MVCRDFILPEGCKPCLLLFAFQFAKIIVPYPARLGLSPVYMSNIETDRKPAPTQEYLEKLAQELHLNVDERRYLLDLAAKSKEQCVSADLPEYIMERDIVRAALRTAKEVDATDEEWQAFIDRLTQRDKDQKGG